MVKKEWVVIFLGLLCVMLLALVVRHLLQASLNAGGPPVAATPKSAPAIQNQATSSVDVPRPSQPPNTPTPSQNGGPASPVRVFFVDPPGYMQRRDSTLWDRQGNVRINSILLPPELPQSVEPSDKTSGGFVGTESCRDCHQDYYDNFIKTSHYSTSSLATTRTILGSFSDGKNKLATKSPGIQFVMDASDKPRQRILVQSEGEEFEAEFEFGLITGSGKLGQTYLYWQGQHLYQMHVSYLRSKDCWVNSPGFADGTANFARPTLAPCLECHATYFQPIGGTTNQFHKDNFILGVSCERCHGPGHQHVETHRRNPELQQAQSIVNPSNLTAQRSIDLCQICHGGMPSALKKPAFSFRAGDDVANYYEFKESADQSPGGVHSNAQLPRLRQSKCFQQSEQMTCITCHDPHHFERSNLALFSQRCQQCHQPQSCPQYAKAGEKFRDNCIDCHMKTVNISDIQLSSDNQMLTPTMRDHYIRATP